MFLILLALAIAIPSSATPPPAATPYVLKTGDAMTGDLQMLGPAGLTLGGARLAGGDGLSYGGAAVCLEGAALPGCRAPLDDSVTTATVADETLTAEDVVDADFVSESELAAALQPAPTLQTAFSTPIEYVWARTDGGSGEWIATAARGYCGPVGIGGCNYHAEHTIELPAGADLGELTCRARSGSAFHSKYAIFRVGLYSWDPIAQDGTSLAFVEGVTPANDTTIQAPSYDMVYAGPVTADSVYALHLEWSDGHTSDGTAPSEFLGCTVTYTA
jgi:hypothetical protein